MTFDRHTKYSSVQFSFVNNSTLLKEKLNNLFWYLVEINVKDKKDYSSEKQLVALVREFSFLQALRSDQPGKILHAPAIRQTDEINNLFECKELSESNSEADEQISARNKHKWVQTENIRHLHSQSMQTLQNSSSQTDYMSMYNSCTSTTDLIENKYDKETKIDVKTLNPHYTNDLTNNGISLQTNNKSSEFSIKTFKSHNNFKNMTKTVNFYDYSRPLSTNDNCRYISVNNKYCYESYSDDDIDNAFTIEHGLGDTKNAKRKHLVTFEKEHLDANCENNLPKSFIKRLSLLEVKQYLSQITLCLDNLYNTVKYTRHNIAPTNFEDQCSTLNPHFSDIIINQVMGMDEVYAETKEELTRISYLCDRCGCFYIYNSSHQHICEEYYKLTNLNRDLINMCYETFKLVLGNYKDTVGDDLTMWQNPRHCISDLFGKTLSKTAEDAKHREVEPFSKLKEMTYLVWEGEANNTVNEDHNIIFSSTTPCSFSNQINLGCSISGKDIAKSRFSKTTVEIKSPQIRSNLLKSFSLTEIRPTNINNFSKQMKSLRHGKFVPYTFIRGNINNGKLWQNKSQLKRIPELKIYSRGVWFENNINSESDSCKKFDDNSLELKISTLPTFEMSDSIKTNDEVNINKEIKSHYTKRTKEIPIRYKKKQKVPTASNSKRVAKCVLI